MRQKESFVRQLKELGKILPESFQFDEESKMWVSLSPHETEKQLEEILSQYEERDKVVIERDEDPDWIGITID